MTISTDPATSARSTTGAALTTSRAAEAFGQQAFLRLLVTQLRHQDPTNPLQPHEFAAQLAQFSSVEQLARLNDGMNELALQGQLGTLMSQTAFGASLVGKDVVVQGSKLEIPATGVARLRLDVGAGGGEARLVLRDANGNKVAERPLGRLVAGVQTVELPSDLPSGTYAYEVEVTGSGGARVPVRGFVLGRVDGVVFQDGRIVLRIGRLEVELADLAEIGAP